MLNVLLEAEYCPLPEVHRLMYDCTQDLYVVKSFCRYLVRHFFRRVDLWTFENPSLNGIRLQLNIKVPLFDLFGSSYHPIELLDASNSLWRLLKKTLPNFRHDFFGLSYLGRYSNQSTKLRRQINILALLPDFEQRLILIMDFDRIGLSEVLNHVATSLVVSVIKDIVFWVHVPLDLVNLVSPVRSVFGHHDGALKLSVDVGLLVPSQPVLNQCLTVLYREELRNIINYQVETTLKDPGRGEEAGPGGNLPLECLGLSWHEKSWISANLAQSRVPKTILDDAVNEAQSDWMILHFGVIKLFKLEC